MFRRSGLDASSWVVWRRSSGLDSIACIIAGFNEEAADEKSPAPPINSDPNIPGKDGAPGFGATT